MGPSDPTTSVRTRILIMSDTHGAAFDANMWSNSVADIAIHCGDLTEESKLEEFATTMRMLKEIDARLKLVIAGNHDFTLDVPTFQQKVSDANLASEPALIQKTYGEDGQARKIIDEAKSAGIMFLDEGHHRFVLDNGACFTVYASPWTPANGDWKFGDWGFQYQADGGHAFDIQEGIDLVITHGPPRGILDLTTEKKRAGCPSLFQAVARARPRLHCFGHIHSGWGAKLVHWRDETGTNPSHFTAIDNERSVLIDNLDRIGSLASENEEDARTKRKMIEKKGCRTTSHCFGDVKPLQYGHETIFVNASVESDEQASTQPTWLVEIDLPEV